MISLDTGALARRVEPCDLTSLQETPSITGCWEGKEAPRPAGGWLHEVAYEAVTPAPEMLNVLFCTHGAFTAPPALEGSTEGVCTVVTSIGQVFWAPLRGSSAGMATITTSREMDDLDLSLSWGREWKWFALRLVAPDLVPSSVRILETTTEDVTDPRTEALAAIDELAFWLHQTREQVARMCGIGLRTMQYWDSGTTTPKPNTVGRLHGSRALVQSLIDALGLSAARSWLQAPAVGLTTSRLETLGEPKGLALVTREAAPLLFESAARPEAPVPELMEAEYAASADPYESSAPRRPLRRARTVRSPSR